tara:strand:- start:37 stop:747 length:711 start_codon:yes stop_codon:yes gene_type:complete
VILKPEVVLSLIYDYKRTNTYESYIKENVKDKIVVDCGAGSGILTHLSIINGATKVYCLESNEDNYNNLVETFKDYTNIEVQKLDCFKNTLPQGDIYLHEFFGSGLWDEGILDFISNLKKQNITNIFPKSINIFSCDYLEYDLDPSVRPYNYDNLSLDTRNFLPQEDWYPAVENKYIYNYFYIDTYNKKIAYSGNLLNVGTKYTNLYLWEVNTKYGTFSNLNKDFSCWTAGINNLT